jgi:hypothetical protein
MAVVETIKIEGDASEFNEALKDLNTRIESLEKQLSRANTEIKEFGDKGEKAIKGVRQEVKETGKGLKDLIKNLGGLAIISKVSDAASEAFTGNQKVVDVLNTGLFTAQLAVSGLIEYLTGSKGLTEAFGSIFSDAKELVKLQKESQRAEIRRIELQFTYQKLAEEQRQIRDEERNSLTDRIQANENLNAILKEQLEREKEAVSVKIAQAEAEFKRLPNIENEIALRQANVELLDIEERIIGQRSEYLSNDLALSRERLEIEQLIAEQEIERFEYEKEINQEDFLVTQQNALKKLQVQKYFDDQIYQLKVDALNKTLELYDQDSVAYQQAVNDKIALDREYALTRQQTENEITELNFEANQQRLEMIQDGFKAIGELSAAFAGEDEASKRAQFEFQKKLSLASAIVSGIEAVQNAYKTAQASPYTTINPSYPVIQAGLAAAFATAQVAAIARTQFESSTIETPTTSSPSQPAQFNIVGQSGTNQLVEGLAGQFDKPIRAYVVSGEVISGAELDRRRLRTATFP